jgi:RecA-family ATPase
MPIEIAPAIVPLNASVRNALVVTRWRPGPGCEPPPPAGTMRQTGEHSWAQGQELEARRVLFQAWQRGEFSELSAVEEDGDAGPADPSEFEVPAEEVIAKASQAASPTVDLTEARRLLDAGLQLTRLEHHAKRPADLGWNVMPVTAIEPDATGYGVLLAANGLCSIDPDQQELADRIMRALGFDLAAIMEAGARTVSTRPGSGGRSTFRAVEGLAWVKFSFEGAGVVLELRANSPNLQDAVPGLVYADRTGALRTQHYGGKRRLDDAPQLEGGILKWWLRMSCDLEFRRDQQRLAGEAIGLRPHRSISAGGKLAFSSPMRQSFNATNGVEHRLVARGYTKHGRRFKAPQAEGSPGIRKVPKTETLWASDHASDPLWGLFDAWTVFVLFEHAENVEAAEAAWASQHQAWEDGQRERTATEFPVVEDPEPADRVPAADRPFRIKPTQIDITRLRPVRWVISGWIAAGEVVCFAGLPGVGKSTAFASLSLVVAGYGKEMGSNVPCDRPRKVAIVSEHPEQYERLLFAMSSAHGLNTEAVARDVLLFETVRLARGEVAREFAHLIDQLTTSEPPLIVLDTASASFALDDENANSEVAAVLAALKPTVTESGAALWIISHAAKAVSREDSEITPRGAGAWMGDVHGTGSVFQDRGSPESTFVRSLKNRAAVTFREIEFVTRLVHHQVVDERGLTQSIGIRIAVPSIPFVDRVERLAGVRAAEVATATEQARTFVIEFLERNGGEFDGRPITQNLLTTAEVRGVLSRDRIRAAVNRLIDEGLVESVPFTPADGKGPRQRLQLKATAGGGEWA